MKFFKKVECPLCLFGSGIVADGKGSKCSVCNGTGKVTKRELIDFEKMLEG
jgi:DnaJ-class molecular chaperone